MCLHSPSLGKGRGEKMHVTGIEKKKVAQNTGRWTFRGVTVSFTGVNAKIGNQVLLSGLKNIVPYF